MSEFATGISQRREANRIDKEKFGHIKRLAKKIRKERGITQSEALEIIAKELGFESYYDYRKEFK